MVKNPPTSAGDARDVNSIPSWKDPLEEGMSTCSSILPGKFHGQRTLTNNSPGATKSQTEHVCACTHTHTHTHIFHFGSNVAHIEVHENICMAICGKSNLPHTVCTKPSFFTLKAALYPFFSTSKNRTIINSVAQDQRWTSSLTVPSPSSPFQ